VVARSWQPLRCDLFRGAQGQALAAARKPVSVPPAPPTRAWLTDAHQRVVFVTIASRDLRRARSEYPPADRAATLLECCTGAAMRDVQSRGISMHAKSPEARERNCPAAVDRGQYLALPNGGAWRPHADCSEARKLVAQLASTSKFLKSVRDNVPVCGPPRASRTGAIFSPTARSSVSRAFPRQDHWQRSDDIFQPRPRQRRCGRPGGRWPARRSLPQRIAVPRGGPRSCLASGPA